MVLSGIQPYWWRVGAFLVVVFFVLLSDAILSDFVPGYIQEKIGSPLLMGLVMAFSSVVGMLLDLIFPQLLRNSGVKKLAGMAMLGSTIFILALLGSTWGFVLAMLLVGMAAWGVYYELDAFMTKQFVAQVAPAHSRPAVWGVVGVVRNLAYFLGPLLGAGLTIWGERGTMLIAGAVLLTAYVFFLVIKLPLHEEQLESPHGLHIWAEVAHWRSLGAKAWPVLTISVLAGVVDATFWTTGTVVNDMLKEIHPAGGWFLSAYMLPSLFVGFAVAKWGIYQGKKKWAERFMLLGGLSLCVLGWVVNIWGVLLVVLIASIFFGLSWPLVDAVYSDFAVRMKRGRKHIIGLSSSTLSLAYIIGPILAGWLATRVGELQSFGWIGGGVVIVSAILLAVTPRKTLLPEQEIRQWE